MFCRNCGKELTENVLFCPACGTKRMEDKNQPQNKPDTENKSEPPKVSPKAAPTGNIFSRIWNSPLFTNIAVKFGNLLEILECIIFILLSKLLFKEGGFFGNAFGILFILTGIIGILNSIIFLLLYLKTHEAEIPDEAAIQKKKRNLSIGIVVIMIIFAVFHNSGGGTYYIVQSITFDDMGSETIGELVDKNIKNPKWSQEKLDSSSKLVYVEGYCPLYGETIKIEFYYEKLDDDSHEVTLNALFFPDSNEKFNALETAIAWAAFYNETDSTP